jgi:hypothetical protein
VGVNNLARSVDRCVTQQGEDSVECSTSGVLALRPVGKPTKRRGVPRWQMYLGRVWLGESMCGPTHHDGENWC